MSTKTIRVNKIPVYLIHTNLLQAKGYAFCVNCFKSDQARLFEL